MDLGDASDNWNRIACLLLSIINLLMFFWLLFQITEMGKKMVKRNEIVYQSSLNSARGPISCIPMFWVLEFNVP